MQFIPILLAPIVLDILFFTLSGLEHSSAVWIGFACANLSYLIFALSGRVKNHSTALNRTARLISFVHFLVHLFIFLISFIFGWLSIKSAIGFHAIAALVFTIVFVASHNKSNQDTEEENKTKAQHDRIRKAQMTVENLWRTTKDTACKKALERLCDDLKSCQYSNNPVIKDLDVKIQNEVDMIREYVMDENYNETIAATTRANQLLSERDTMIRMNR